MTTKPMSAGLAALAATLTFATEPITPSSVAAAAPQTVLNCPSSDGRVRVWDGERGACGSLRYNNSDWRNIGNPVWDNRIDEYGNDDWTNGRTMCLYDGYNYTNAVLPLAVGHASAPIGGYDPRPWYNRVSSNRWTTSGC